MKLGTTGMCFVIFCTSGLACLGDYSVPMKVFKPRAPKRMLESVMQMARIYIGTIPND
jgi:hypothetical protein